MNDITQPIGTPERVEEPKVTMSAESLADVARALGYQAAALEASAQTLRSQQSYLLRQIAKSRHPHALTAAQRLAQGIPVSISPEGSVVPAAGPPMCEFCHEEHWPEQACRPNG